MVPLELTLAILKPHIISNPYALSCIRNLITNSNFKIVLSKLYKLSNCDAQQFYQEHRRKFFYNRLVTCMTSGPSELYILAGNNVIQSWRKLMGPTKVYKAQYELPNTIRGTFGLSDTRNATHGSDSQLAAYREIKVLFPEFDITGWYANVEPELRKVSSVLYTSKLVDEVLAM